MLSLKMNQVNAAFGKTTEERNTETARILQELASKLLAGVEDCAIFDINGNRIGTMATT